MKRKTLILLLILLVLAVLIVIAYIKRDTISSWFNAGNSSNTSVTTALNNTNTVTGNTPSAFPLKLGSNNSYVKKLQQYFLSVNSNCLPTYGADGDWGNETESCSNSVLGTDVVTYSAYQNLGLS